MMCHLKHNSIHYPNVLRNQKSMEYVLKSFVLNFPLTYNLEAIASFTRYTTMVINWVGVDGKAAIFSYQIDGNSFQELQLIIMYLKSISKKIISFLEKWYFNFIVINVHNVRFLISYCEDTNKFRCGTPHGHSVKSQLPLAFFAPLKIVLVILNFFFWCFFLFPWQIFFVFSLELF